MLQQLLAHFDYLVVSAVFCTGLYILLVRQNLVKKLIGLNIMETAVFAFIVTTGMIDGGDPPLLGADLGPLFASPIPQALVLTGIVVAVSTTALALALIVRVKRETGTIELDELLQRDERR
ncbi:MAG: cation:proton antiporter subunit C [Wenzhouxiangellaceae bacterium]|nr:cation:proton antiporter subunit C [Wenzhouxiangellaceae bacterium]